MHALRNINSSLLPDVIITVVEVHEHILLHNYKVLLHFKMIRHQLDALLCRLVPHEYIAERIQYFLIVSGEALLQLGPYSESMCSSDGNQQRSIALVVLLLPHQKTA